MKIRQTAVAGTFYPDDPNVLTTDINNLITQAISLSLNPKAMILPHAGIIYSGNVAATGYQILKKLSNNIKRIILLGPSHYVGFAGLALPDCDVFQTPIGNITIDTKLAATLVNKFDQVVNNSEAHFMEHSLEVHCPFLLCCLDDFMLLPLVVGQTKPEEVAEVIEFLWGGDETMIIVSSDLSHYHDYATAKKLDETTAQAIESLQTNITGDQACGCNPINGMLSTAKNKKLQIQRLLLQNSGDTAGDKNRVVGYGAFALL